MDNYKPGKDIPYFAIDVKLKDTLNCRPPKRKIYVGEQGAFITIARDPDSQDTPDSPNGLLQSLV